MQKVEMQKTVSFLRTFVFSLALITLALAANPALAESAARPAEDVEAAAARSTCTCYYGYDSDCPKGFICRGNFTGADKCIRMKGPGATRKEQKGGAWRKDGKGCTIKDGDGNGVVAACDGTCVEKKKKDECANDSLDLIQQSFSLWAQAMTDPGLAGGGPIDPNLAAAARSTGVSAECAEYLGWRAMGITELCRGNDAIDHLEDQHDSLDDHQVVDLAGDGCLIESGNKCYQAVVDGMDDPAAVDPLIDSIVDDCPDGLPFGTTGLEDPPLEAVKERIGVTVEYLAEPVIATEPMPIPWQ